MPDNGAGLALSNKDSQVCSANSELSAVIQDDIEGVGLVQAELGVGRHLIDDRHELIVRLQSVQQI